MYIKRFRRGYEAVTDPLHPTRTVRRPVLKPSQVSSFVYRGTDGVRHEIEPDEDGWFDVPEDVGQDHCKFRTPEGEGWYPETDVAEERRLGRVEPEPPEPTAPPARPTSKRPATT